MESPRLVCDTTVLLYLGRIGRIEVLPRLFAGIDIPESAAFELDVGRLARPETINARGLSWARIVTVPCEALTKLPTNSLGAGEQGVIAWASSHPGMWAGLDDALARRFASRLKIPVMGTLGLLIQAKKQGYISLVSPLIESLISSGFRIGPEVAAEIKRLADE